jgi:two-component system, response regulator PdtaR
MGSDLPGQTVKPLFILVVEDHALVRDLVVHLLKGAGHPTIAVPDADRAFALWSKFPDGFKLIITDILMPSSLDGLTFGRLVQTHRPDVPVLYISGSENPDAAATLVQGQNFFRKPFDPDEFLATVDRLLERRARRPAPVAYSGVLAAPDRG